MEGMHGPGTMADILIADIGGTTSRAAFASFGGRPEGIVTIANDSVDGPEGVLARLLDGAPQRPRAAVLALAAPVSGEEIALTNRNWCVRLPDLSARFGISPIHAVNDFEALAWALPQLRPDDLQPIGEAHIGPDGVKLVVGPGTGLGVAALVPTGSGHHVIASEAGHTSFGPAYADEEPIFHRLAETKAPLSAECVLSGSGLSALHEAMHPGTLKLKPDMLVRQARAGNRRRARRWRCSCGCSAALRVTWRWPFAPPAASISRAAWPPGSVRCWMRGCFVRPSSGIRPMRRC
jgi:glucokinase